MKRFQTCLLAVSVTAGLGGANPISAESEAAVVAEAQAKSATVSGRIQLPELENGAAGKEALAFENVVVKIESVLKRFPYPTPENWEQMTRDEQVAWAKTFRETEEYSELVRRNKEARAAQVVMTIGVDDDGRFSFEGLAPNTYMLQALIKRPGAIGKLSKNTSLAYNAKRVVVKEMDATVDLGEIMLEAQEFLSPGDLAPAWTATAYDGSKVSLSDFRGKYVLVDFWATWCGPCKAEVPNLEAVYADFGGEKFEIVGLSLDATLDLPKGYHEKKPSPYTNLYLGKWNEETTTADYGIRGIPSIWLIGPDGKIVARDLRGKALREAVRAAMEGPAERAAVAETKVESD